jgi:hypothetical protein
MYFINALFYILRNILITFRFINLIVSKYGSLGKSQQSMQQTIPVSKVNLKPVTLYIVIFSIPRVNVIVLSQQEIKILKEKSFLTSLTPNRLMKSKSQTYTTHKCKIYTQTSSRSTTSLSRKNGK